MMIYNSDTGQVEAYQDGSWSAVGGAGTFTDLTDTPSSYTGKGGDVVLVKTTEDGIETQPWPVTGTVLNYFLSDNAADVGSYYYLHPTGTEEAASELASSTLTTGADQLLWSFITEAGEPGVDVLSLGAYTATLFLKKTGNKDVRVYWKLFKRDTSGTETELLQSAASDYLATDNSQHLISAYLNEDQALDPTDRLVLKLYANVSGTGTDVTVTLTMEGDYDSRLTINVLSSAFNLDRLSDVTISSPADDEVLGYDSRSGKWINQTPSEAGLLAADGSVPLTGDLNADGHDLLDLGGLIGREGADIKVEMAVPTGVTAAASSTSGSLGAGTYYYRVTARDGSGETIGSTEVSATIDGSTNTAVDISWDAVPGAASYRVYGRASGAQDQYWETTGTSYTDDGTAGTTGTVPTSTTAYVNKLTASGNSWILGGNVGIGTTSPVRPLDVNGIINASGVIYSGSNTASVAGFTANSSSSTYNYFRKGGVDQFAFGYRSSADGFVILPWDGSAWLDAFCVDKTGNVGIGTTSPGYKLDVSGDIHCTGKLTSDGGNDPPYVLYNYETRDSIIDRVKKEVLPDKLNGAVLFFNGDQEQLELFLPSKGEFRSLDGKVLKTVEPITQTFETEDRYYFDEDTGEIKTYKAKKAIRKYRLKPDHEIDPRTGKIKRKIREIDSKTGEEVEIGEEEVSLDEAIEQIKEEKATQEK